MKMGEKRKRPRGKEKKDQEIHFRISKTELEEIELASYALDESKSDIFRKALRMYLSGIKGSY
jgi:hypothetical protein